ncbi:hypothetical protein T06_3137 [Trichinella sp. T6]|nr:hypothetical protein T06_3137 [Trichinella sp. T6]
MEGKGICRGYWNIVSVNQVDLFVGLTREFEDWQKIIRRLVVLIADEINTSRISHHLS